jgi:RNA polymerase sigma factor (sigma-70 family)
MTAPDADDELMARVSAGDGEAFAALYERHKRPLFTFLVHLTGQRPRAEDLLQESFLRVWRRRRQYQAAGHFRAWLFTIARHLAIDWMRRERIAWEDEARSLAAAAAPERADHPAEARELAERLEEALGTLPPAQREIVLLSRVAGMSAGEVAAVVETTPGAVRVALHRALRRLHELAGDA